MEKTKIVFLDVVCNKAYDPYTLREEPLGGTEATVVRIAEELANDDRYEVLVYQEHRKKKATHSATYLPAMDITELQATGVKHVVSIRAFEPLAMLSQFFKDAKTYVWLHDLMVPTKEILQAKDLLNHLGTTLITVSGFHRAQVMQAIDVLDDNKFKLKRIFNPIDDKVVPRNVKTDPNKLVFFSSPHKGLEQVLTVFDYVKMKIPKLKLYIANPGYFETQIRETGNVKVLGSLSNTEVLKHVAESFCVFYPTINYDVRETFGLVFAEANALGVPVLAHKHGAAHEILHKNNEPFDCTRIQDVIDTMQRWYKDGRPKVEADPRFRLSNVIQDWKKLFK